MYPSRISAGMTAIVTTLSMAGSAFALNPQPEPPSRSTGVTRPGVLVAQPRFSARLIQKADLVGLNPQPEPPSRPVSRVTLVGLNPQPEPPSRTQTAPMNSRSIIIQHRAGMVRELSPRSTDRSLTEMQLQSMSQKQSQIVQMMGNVSKSLHESSLSVVRNIK